MEERKVKEIEHYDTQAEQQADTEKEFFPVLASQQFLYKIAVPLVAGKKVLDYGCGEGIHIPFLAQHAAQVVGIDLSQGALATARKRAQQAETVTLVKMDCEVLELEDASFDTVFDGGTFSSLDFSKAMGEITRVLKPNGALVGIETFGHNPLANAKRTLNRLTGKRTAWASSHIVTTKEIELLKKHFEQVEVYYFHLISLFAFPLLGLPGGNFVLKLAEQIDVLAFSLPFLRKYAFKVVFVAKHVKKNI